MKKDRKRPSLETPDRSSSAHVLVSGVARCDLLVGVVLGALPDRQAEGNLVDEVGQIVDQVEDRCIDCPAKVPEEVAEGVDRPADGDDELHGVECLLDVPANLIRSLASLASEDLEQDEAPPCEPEGEAHPGVDESSLTHVAGGKHEDGAQEQAEEHASTDVFLHCAEDEVPC